jgi:hypothetical protein
MGMGIDQTGHSQPAVGFQNFVSLARVGLTGRENLPDSAGVDDQVTTGPDTLVW